MTSLNPEIDYSTIDLPTDRLTLGELRKMAAGSDYRFLDRLHDDLESLLYMQEGFIRLGFAGVISGKKGQEEVLDDIAAEGRKPAAEAFLVDQYIRYRLAGPETAKLAIRRLEELGAERAREQIGRTSP